QQFLTQTGYTESIFLSEIKNTFLINQLKTAIIDSAFALKNELTQSVALQNQTRFFDYLVIPHTLFTAKMSVSPETIDTYYQEHQSTFKTLEKVKVDYLLLTPEEVKKTLQVSEKQIKNYYEENKATYKDKPLREVKDPI